MEEFYIGKYRHVPVINKNGVWLVERYSKTRMESYDVVIQKKIKDKYHRPVHIFGENMRYPSPSEFGMYGWNYYPTEIGKELAYKKLDELSKQSKTWKKRVKN